MLKIIIIFLLLFGVSHIGLCDDIPTPDPNLVIYPNPLQDWPTKMKEVQNAYLYKRITYFQYLQLKYELEWECTEVGLTTTSVLTLQSLQYLKDKYGLK